MLHQCVVITEADLSIQLKYVVDEPDEHLIDAQEVLAKKLSAGFQSDLMITISDIFREQGILLLEKAGTRSASLVGWSLDLRWLSNVRDDFSWSWGTSKLGLISLDTDVTQAAKGKILSIWCVVNSIRVSHFTRDESSMLHKLVELKDASYGLPGELDLCNCVLCIHYFLESLI